MASRLAGSSACSLRVRETLEVVIADLLYLGGLTGCRWLILPRYTQPFPDIKLLIAELSHLGTSDPVECFGMIRGC